LKQQWCIPTASSEFVAAMEDVLDLYATPYDPKRPKVIFDESIKQLILLVNSPNKEHMHFAQLNLKSLRI
jgi:hypothetical protein